MSNILDYRRFSSYVGAIVDRKIRGVAIAFSTSSMYLKSLQLTASNAALTAGTFATNASNSAAAAAISEANTNQKIQTLGPTLFVVLNRPELQTVSGPITFGQSPTVPNITDWTTTAVVPAKQIQNKFDQVVIDRNNAIATEVTNRNDAINTAINSEVTNRNSAITTAINNEVTNRNSALSAGDAAVLAAVKTFTDRFARGSNAIGNWELRPGIIEMWGRYLGTATNETSINFSFPLILPDTSYTMTGTPIIRTSSDQYDLWIQIIEGSRGTSSMSVFYQSSTRDNHNLDGFDWRIIIAVPFDYVATENTAPVTGNNNSNGNTVGGGGGGSGGINNTKSF